MEVLQMPSQETNDKRSYPRFRVELPSMGLCRIESTGMETCIGQIKVKAVRGPPHMRTLKEVRGQQTGHENMILV